MSTLGIIIVVVVVVAILVALFAFLPRMRERRRIKTGERELGQRRERVVSEQRQEAERRAERAEAAEQQARIAAAEAERERAEANLHQQQAVKHERGMADHELVDDHERDRFAGTSAAPDAEPGQSTGDEQGATEREDWESTDRVGGEQRLADR